ncbi:MAG: hypothetical protein WCK28_16850, partial [Burkholderiales bacterium]
GGDEAHLVRHPVLGELLGVGQVGHGASVSEGGGIVVPADLVSAAPGVRGRARPVGSIVRRSGARRLIDVDVNVNEARLRPRSRGQNGGPGPGAGKEPTRAQCRTRIAAGAERLRRRGAVTEAPLPPVSMRIPPRRTVIAPPRSRRPIRLAPRAWVAAWLLVLLPLYGLGGLATQLLGPLHVHARVQKAQPAPSTLDRWLVRIDHMVDHVVDHLLEHAHPAGTRHALARPQDDRAVNDDVRAAAHAHAHARAERHHHDPNHADVFAVAEPERDDGTGTSGWAWQVVAPGSASGALPERTDAGRWPSAPADALDSRPPERLERPPRA